MFVFYILLFTTMCIGIRFSSAFRAVNRSHEDRVKVYRALGDAFESRSLTLGMLDSPIVFAALATQISAEKNSLVAFVASFQNGFFWENIFKTFDTRRENTES